MRYFLSVLAMVLIIEGIPYSIFPGRFKDLIRLLEKIEDSNLRLIGISMMILGIILLYISKG